MLYKLETQLRLLDLLHQKDPVKALAQYFAAVERLSGRDDHESEASTVNEERPDLHRCQA